MKTISESLKTIAALTAFLLMCFCKHACADGPMMVNQYTVVEYFHQGRVWNNDNGELLICPYDKSIDDLTFKDPEFVKHPCYDEKYRGVMSKGVSGWQLLRHYEKVGYKLLAVQFNDTAVGPSLVLFWDPLPKTLKDAAKHQVQS